LDFPAKIKAMFKKTFFLLIIVALFSSCATHKYSQLNHAKFYQEDYPGNVFKTKVFNANDSISELFVQVDLTTLAVVSGKSKVEVLKEYVFDYSLVDGNKEKEVLQVGRINLADSPDKSENHKSFKIKLHTQANGVYTLFASLENKSGTKAFTSRTNILKGVSYSKQNFMLLNEDGSIHWDNFARGDEKLQIKLSDLSVEEMYISWYAPKFSPAVVPFDLVKPNELKDLESTTPFKIKIKEGKSAPLAFKDLGVYLFHLTAEEKRGFTVLKFFNAFPYIVNDAQRLFALRYLNPRWEFEDLMNMKPEKAVSEFWYFKSREVERSDDMVRTYYSRVQRANELFTSYKEGWKTDRGMIFMIYGAPDKVYKFKDREVWEYGYNAFYTGLRFHFSREENPFSQNDFRLFRQAHYEPSWQGIVGNWRTDI
jgi:GWxTD domain-containing protein